MVVTPHVLDVMRQQPKSAFEAKVREQVQAKNMPNAEFLDQAFRFGDYFDKVAFEEGYTGDASVDDVVDDILDVYRTYLGGVDEITFNAVEEDDKVWFDVTVELPDDIDRQHLLADLIVDAWERRRQR